MNDRFRLAVGELTTESGLLRRDFTGFLTRFKLWIIIHNIITRRFRPAPALTLRFEFRLDRQADSDPLAARIAELEALGWAPWSAFSAAI